MNQTKTCRSGILLLILLLAVMSIAGGCAAQSGGEKSAADQTNEGEDLLQESWVTREADPLSAEELSGDCLILVNKLHPVEKGEPDDLVYAPYYADRSGTYNRYIRKEACEAYGRLVEAAKTDGYDIRLTSAFRTYDVQKSYYDRYVQTKGQEWADKYSAKPGTSEHQTGLAIDVSSPSVNWELTDGFADTEEGRWLAAHCGEYGFIIRYPKGREEITGYSYEPWHIRYVGVAVAAEICEKDWTLEEYLANL